MDHSAIRQSALVLPDDEQRGVQQQLGELDQRIADLEALPIGTPGHEVRRALQQAHSIASALFHEAAGHPNGGNVAGWYLSAIKCLNQSADRLGVDPCPAPWSP